ncbi:MAG: hypothetical protein IKJ22_07235 [Paludibacteraceae bacterium]|nr:hypothetical protein [Paludibacteraceae bacterium]
MKKLFFALITSFLFVATAWGQCISGNLQESEYTLGIGDSKEYSLNGRPIISVKFDANRNMATGIGELQLAQKINGSWVKVWGANPGEYIFPSMRYVTYTCDISPNATDIKFYTEGTSYKKLLKNLFVTYSPTATISSDEVNFGALELGTSAPERKINISYSALDVNLTASIGAGVFSIDKTIVVNAGCSHGTATLNITFKPTAVGAYSDVITFSNGTKVNVYGECSKSVCTKLEVAKISYTSVLLRWNKVVDADLSGFQIINQATGAIYYADKDDTSLNVTGLEMGKSYSFVIFPLLNGARSLCASNIVPITTNKTDKIKECLVYTSVGKDNNEQNLIASDAINDLISYDIKSGNSNSLRYTKRVTFEVKWGNWALIEPSMGARGDMCMYVKVEGESGFREEKYWSAANVSLTKEYQKFSALIPHNTVAIEFRTGLSNGAAYRYVKNLEVYKDYILQTPIAELKFGEVEPNVSVTKTFDITYAHDVVLSEIAYDNAMKTIIGDGLGFYKVECADNDDCAEGTQTVTVTFTPTNCAKEYNATLTLINGAVLEIPLKGELKRNPGTVSEITWTGEVDTNWDNRANWIKADDNVLSVADVLDAELQVNIPGGLEQYPVIPDVSTQEAFKTIRDKKCDCAQVNAGDNATATEIAHKIIMKSGAALVGVETLNSGNTPRYTEVQMYFTPERYSQSTGYYEWSLVGPVVKPWDEENPNQTRDVLSGDYYKNDLPHVYMHEAVMTNNDGDYIQTWDNSFASLTVNIPHNKAFAIRMPNQYGRNSSGYGIPAQVYNRKNGTNYDHTEDITFTFTGRFYNEAGLPIYTGLTPEVPVLLNNTYPANIDADMLQSKGYGTIQCYEGHSFVDVTGRTDAVISSGYGFIFTPNVAEFTIPSDCFQTTKVINNRNAEAEVPSLRLQLKNEDVDGVYSTISISHDELKDDAADYAVDAPKLFNDMESNLADLYVMRYDSKWAGLSVPTVEESLPLGIKVRTANQKYRFNLLNSNLDYDIILEDRQEGKEYNLSAGEVCEVSNLAVGDCRGRFYLKTSESSEDDDEVTTDILDNEKSASIDIYAQGNSVVVSSTNNVNIQKIVVSDLSGRQMNYNVSGQYIVLDLPVSSGIYTINVMGDTANRIEKIKLN